MVSDNGRLFTLFSILTEFEKSSVRVCDFSVLGVFCHISCFPPEISLHICLDSGANCSEGQHVPWDASAASVWLFIKAIHTITHHHRSAAGVSQTNTYLITLLISHWLEAAFNYYWNNYLFCFNNNHLCEHGDAACVSLSLHSMQMWEGSVESHWKKKKKRITHSLQRLFTPDGSRHIKMSPLTLPANH